MRMPTDYDALPSPVPGYESRRDLLIDLYLKQKLTINMIAGRLDQSHATISRWLLEHSIVTRPRGGDQATSKVGWTLHRMDQRYVKIASLAGLACSIDASTSAVYKYRRGVMPR